MEDQYYENEEIKYSEDLYFQIQPVSFSRSQTTNFTVSITNNGEEEIPAGSKIVLEEVAYFCDRSTVLLEDPLDVGYYVETIFEFRPRCKSFRNVPEFVVFRVGEKCYRCPLEMRFFFSFFDELPVAESGAAQLNILLLGLAGATKSSFVNSVHTLFSEGVHPVSIATSGSTQSHVTQHLNRYAVRPNISLWDMWGITPANHQAVMRILPSIFAGRLPSGWGMKDSVLKHQQNIDRNLGSADKRRIHATILFVPQSLVNDPNLIAQKQAVIALKKHLKERFNMEALVLLTKMDEVDATIRDDPFADSSVQAVKEQVEEEFDAHAAHVFYNLNYMEEERRNFQLDKLNFIILEYACRLALEFLRMQKGKSPTK